MYDSKRAYFDLESALDNADETINVIVTNRGSRYERRRKMSIAEAIRMLTRIKDRINCEVTDAQAKMDALNMAIEALTEQKVGKWINKDYGIGECSAQCDQCKIVTPGKAHDDGFGFDYTFYDYCPNCGARMMEGEQENE